MGWTLCCWVVPLTHSGISRSRDSRAGLSALQNPKPHAVLASVLTMWCGLSPVPGGRCPACPGTAALPVARAAPRQSHLMERGGIQDPAEREVGHPLEVPGKGREMSAPTLRSITRGFRLHLRRVFELSQGFTQHASCPIIRNASR